DAIGTGQPGNGDVACRYLRVVAGKIVRHDRHQINATELSVRRRPFAGDCEEVDVGEASAHHAADESVNVSGFVGEEIVTVGEHERIRNRIDRARDQRTAFGVD